MDLNGILNLIKAGESEFVEFKRTVGKDIQKVIVALANAEGGHILIGVNDEGEIVGTDLKKSINYLTNSIQSAIPSPKISTKKFKINNKGILVIFVSKSDVLCSIGGVAYIRIGAGIRPLSIQEILMLSSEIGTIEWDNAPVASLKYGDHRYLDWFFKKMEESRGRSIDKKNRIQYLKSIGAIKNNKLTNAGILFFTNTHEILPQSKLRLIYVEKEEPVGEKEFIGPVWKMIEEVYTELIREISKTEVIISARRRKVEGYPIRALRESVINAVAHRNYVIQADIRLFLHSDKLIIKNPGGLMPGVNLSDPEHVPRNPSLCNLLYDCGFIERYGYGIRMIRNEVDRYPGLSLNIDTTSNRFQITFSKDISVLLDDTDLKILEILTDPLRNSEISKRIGLTKPATLMHLKKLEQLGLIKKIGAGPQIKYVIK